jgi:hypothetical protein
MCTFFSSGSECFQWWKTGGEAGEVGLPHFSVISDFIAKLIGDVS